MKTIKTTVMALSALAAMAGLAGEPTVTDITAKQRYPWNGLVDNAPCQSEQVGVGAGAGEGQNKNVVLNSVEKKPVGRDVAVARSLHVAGKRMVAVLTDCVLHDSRNSRSLAGSLQDGALGSCAMRFASSIASSVSSRGVLV